MPVDEQLQPRVLRRDGSTIWPCVCVLWKTRGVLPQKVVFFSGWNCFKRKKRSFRENKKGLRTKYWPLNDVVMKLWRDLNVKRNKNFFLCFCLRSGHAVEPRKVWVQRLVRVRAAPPPPSPSLWGSSLTTCRISLLVARSDYLPRGPIKCLKMEALFSHRCAFI